MNMCVLQQLFDVMQIYLKEAFGDKFTSDAAQGFRIIFTGFLANIAKQYDVIAEQQQQ